MKQNFKIVLVPIVVSAVTVVYILWWTITQLYVMSIGEKTRRADLPIPKIVRTSQWKYYMYTHIFALFWMCALLLYISDFIVIMTTCLWYFNSDPKTGKNQMKGPIKKSIWWTFRYHLGSLGVGSFFLAVIWVMRVILAYVEHQMNKKNKSKKGGKESCGTKMVFKCLHCVLACAERIVRMINKAGYAIVALKSQNFCKSCLEGIMLTLRNPGKFGIMTILGSIFVSIGKVFIGAITAACGYFMLENISKIKDAITSPIVPVIIMFIIGLVIGTLFMSIYGISADTILMCFLLTKEVNPSGKVRCPAPMQKFFKDNKDDHSSSEEEGE